MARKIVLYLKSCSRGEIIALLYNNAIRVKGTDEKQISAEEAEELVRQHLGYVITMHGKREPSQDGFIGALNNIELNVTCYNVGIDVSRYPYGDAEKIIEEFYSKRIHDTVSLEVRSGQHERLMVHDIEM